MGIVAPLVRPLVDPLGNPLPSGDAWDGGGAGGEWTPLRLGVARTLELIGGVGLTEVAGPKYSAWADQSGNANNYTQGTDANRPLVGSINGLACPDFTGASVQLVGPAFSAVISASAYEIWCVVNLDAIAARRIFGASAELSGAEMRTVTSTFQGISWDSGGADVTTGIACATLTTYMVGTRLSGGTLTLDAVGTTQSVASGSVASLTDTTRLIPDGRVGHVLVCNRALTVGERASVKGYLSNRYGAV